LLRGMFKEVEGSARFGDRDEEGLSHE
jgi:hypothetical protein